ncbi:phytohormone-binding protein-like [Diospyros lotus]|uniref:phytohormone-binding protein-like n=1 Tax=Diospyros lotus TaxID=55363 RepID=UPI00225989EE|nr:phytohormone-binding protein-like [Diospyros lotus]
MAKEANAQTKVKVEVESIWKAVAKDLRFIAPKILPSKVKSVEVLEGDGFSVGSIMRFNFVPDISPRGYQNEKVVELDEERHRVGLQVVEAGRFDIGFKAFKITYQFTAQGEKETLVDINLAYEMNEGATEIPAEDLLKSPLTVMQCFEDFLTAQNK